MYGAIHCPFVDAGGFCMKKLDLVGKYPSHELKVTLVE
jgi:hypothetical protein